MKQLLIAVDNVLNSLMNNQQTLNIDDLIASIQSIKNDISKNLNLVSPETSDLIAKNEMQKEIINSNTKTISELQRAVTSLSEKLEDVKKIRAYVVNKILSFSAVTGDEGKSLEELETKSNAELLAILEHKEQTAKLFFSDKPEILQLRKPIQVNTKNYTI